MFIVFAGLPGTGKSSIARQLALELGGVWLRIDTIEQAIRASGAMPGERDDAGYRVGYGVARDNLRLGRCVVSDSVNPWMLTRDAWRDVGIRAGVSVLEVEMICSDPAEHRRRVEARVADVPGLVLPDWQAVRERDYHPWNRERLIVDTAVRDVSACVRIIRTATT